jgi:glycosyltransferase involved in cell wall biosynthesis
VVLVVYEAYEHAKPVLAARSGGLTETVVEGRRWLLRQASPEAWRTDFNKILREAVEAQPRAGL